MILQTFLVLLALCVGIVLGNRDFRRRRRGWKFYAPSTNPLRDYK